MSLNVADRTQDADPPGMEPLFAALLQDNPFLSSAVNGPAEGEIDVGTVHQQQFRELVESAEEAQGTDCRRRYTTPGRRIGMIFGQAAIRRCR